MSKKIGILLIGHGSKDPEGIQEYFDFLSILKPMTQAELKGGFIEFATPTLKEALQELVGLGVQEIVGVPLILLGALHQKTDGPELIDFGRTNYQNINFYYGRPLGIHPKVLEVARDRIKSVVSQHKLELNSTAVALISRGSTDPDANSDLYKIARLISDDPELPRTVLPGFVSLASPNVFNTLKMAKNLGFTDVVIAPYFLFTGVLCKRIYTQAQEAGELLGLNVFNAKHLGPDQLIAQAVTERFDEARAGKSVMNCDLCAYRIKMPGYEYKLSLHNHH